MSNLTERVGIVDAVVFGGLESLGVFAILGNLALITVLLRNKYLNRASFILMLNLAIADMIHGFVTTCHFYPPIVLKQMHIGELGIRLFNIADWTAWAITLTHMSAICIDRLIAIILYGRYNILVTVPRIRRFSTMCWVVFLTTNITLFSLHACCMIRPLESLNYYSFGYDQTEKERFNVYVLTYTPLEIVSIIILTVTNPVTLVQLYRRHKRKAALKQHGVTAKSSSSSSLHIRQQRSQWQRASTILLEMSMKMGPKNISSDVKHMAMRRSNRQQQRILFQITVVALIFYCYMTAYYISFYSRWFQSKAAMIFNSYFYSTTHMINPVIYFSLNKEMRTQLKNTLKDLRGIFDCKKKDPYGFAHSSTKFNQSTKATIDVENRSSSCSETSPLFSSTNHYKSTAETDIPRIIEEPNDTTTESESPSAEIRAIVARDGQSDKCSSPRSDVYESKDDLDVENGEDVNTVFISRLKEYNARSSLRESCTEKPRRIDKSATTSDISQTLKKKYIRFSQTMQHLSKENMHSLIPTPFNVQYSSIGSLDRSQDSEKSAAGTLTKALSSSISRLLGREEKDEIKFLTENSDSEDEEIAYL